MEKKSYRATLEDSFSKAVKLVDITITDKQYESILRQIKSKEVVHRTFEDAINWAWRVKSIKEI